MSRFEAAGFVNLAAELIGDASYSFEFNGQFGALDHAVATPALAEIVVDLTEWHINADESRIHDYNPRVRPGPEYFQWLRALPLIGP